MADFAMFYPRLQQNEGGHYHDLKDKGGETYKGIARNYHEGLSG
jgi:lysozyme family protein